MGNAVLQHCPRLLIFVQGAGRQNGGGDSDTCWGGSFTDAKRIMASPVPLLKDQTKLVFSPHAYGPSLYKLKDTARWMPHHFRQSIDNYPTALPAKWDAIWGFATEVGMRPPLVLSETGGDMTCCDQKELHAPGADAAWQVQLLLYLDKKGAGIFYFCMNPFSDDTGGILKKDWRTPEKEKLLMLSAARSTRIVFLGMSPSLPPRPPPLPPRLPPSSRPQPPPSPPPPSSPSPHPLTPRPWSPPPSPCPLYPPVPLIAAEETNVIQGKAAIPFGVRATPAHETSLLNSMLGHAGTLSVIVATLLLLTLALAFFVLVIKHRFRSTAGVRSTAALKQEGKQTNSYRKSKRSRKPQRCSEDGNPVSNIESSAVVDEPDSPKEKADFKLDEVLDAIINKHAGPATDFAARSFGASRSRSKRGYGLCAGDEEQDDEGDSGDEEEENGEHVYKGEQKR